MVARTISALVALSCIALVKSDVYLHMPKGSNNRLNERSANRNNGNRMFDSQNNNRGGYNKGDRSAGGGFQTNDASYDITYYMSTPEAYYNNEELGRSMLSVEWTNQHGCGGNEHNDPHKLNCNINIQYMCQPDYDVFKSVTDAARDDCTISCQIPNPKNPTCSSAVGVVQCRDSHIKTAADCSAAGYIWATSTVNDKWNCPHNCAGQADQASKTTCNAAGGTWTNGHHTTDCAATEDATQACRYTRDGLTTARQEFTQGGNDETQANRLTRRNDNIRSERGLHEQWEWYDECSQRHRNRGLFTADQNLRGNSAIYTRQNPNNNRRGYECPEERDHFPYWHDSPWQDVVIMTDRLDLCPFFQQESQNVHTKNQCRNTEACPQCVRYNNKKQCEELNGNWVTIASHNVPAPACIQAPWSRVNHLGNGRHGQANSYNWTLPFVPKKGANLGTALADLEGMPSRCVMRLRYNISTDDYNPWMVNASFNENNGQGIDSPVEQNPEVDIGAKQALRLAINTNQFNRVFQDRTHTFKLLPRPAAMGKNKLWNLNVRGKRGNIVQTFPSVEYDFQPNHLEIDEETLVHIQWAGSNTHNNGNPAGDGQAGDAGEGTGGTDRHNFVEMKHGAKEMGESFPATWEENTIFKNALSFWDPNPETRTTTAAADAAGNKAKNWALRMATVGMYPEDTDTELNNLLNNAKASYMGGVFRFKKGTYNAMCTRNHNFSNRDQRAFIKVL